MAEKIDSGDNSSSSLQNLTCPLCLDIFEEATLLTCKHTFCRKCLKKYDLSHQDLDHMVCPLCRETTKLSSNRVEDLPANVNVNELVDDYHSKSGGVNAVLEMRPKCTSCDFKADAVSFCRTCNSYVCDECLHSHQRLKVFRGHKIVSIQDIIEGKVSIGRSSEKCSKHTQEDKDFFCDNCKIHVCHKCVIVGHRDHTVKNQDDFEKELHLKVNELVKRSTSKKSELEKNIKNVEEQRHEVHVTMQKLREDVSEAWRKKAKQLQDNHQLLMERIDLLERDFGDHLTALKSSNRQKIKSICSSTDLVANDRLGHLETESLSAHTLLCEKLETILKEAIDYSSAAIITRKAQKKRFNPADDTRLDLGNISELEPGPSQAVTVKEATGNSSAEIIMEKAQKRLKPKDRDNISESDPKPSQAAKQKDTTEHSAAAATKKTQKKMFKPVDKTPLNRWNISELDPDLQVIKSVDLPGYSSGLTKVSADCVAVGYFWPPICRLIYSTGYIKYYAEFKTYDLVFQSDRTLYALTSHKQACIYSPKGRRMRIIHRSFTGYPTVNASPTDEILLANGDKEIRIYDKTGSTVKHTVPLRHITRQASATRMGLIITSSCNRGPSVVTVYDRNGNAGKPLQAPGGVYLYAAVDERDRVYVASVDRKKGKLVIRLYDIDGLNLKERVEFNALKLALNDSWCYLVSLSPNLLAFACSRKLYFIKVSL